jgi:asparagine synthase (glutamine-hydrolysing)
MCGIVGVLAPPGARVERAVLERMLARLRHRGPDATGIHVEGRIGLGVARLRVIDLATGDQPIANEDGSVQVAFNGEIYNHLALRADLAARGHRFRTNADTEVIAHAWEEHGEACLDNFDGMFALAVWDRRRERLFLGRDRMGEKPLYYTRVGGWLVFASELTAVLAHPTVGREVDLASVSRYLAYDFVPDPYSMIRNVAKLPPAHSLVAAGGTLALRRYWDLHFRPDPAPDEATWREQIGARLDDAVRARLASDVPLGCFLSGGIDSSAIAATACRLRPGLRTFSVGYAERAHDERPFARAVAERIGAEHEELLVSAADAGDVVAGLGDLLDEPIADMSFVPLHLLSRAARRHVTVALTGDGGDELFAGYPAMGAQWWHDAFARLPRPVRSRLSRLADDRRGLPDALRRFLQGLEYPRAPRNQLLLGGLAPHEHARILSPAVRAAISGFDAYADIARTLESCGPGDRTARLIYQYCKLYMAGQNLANADRASMATSLELRAPFLDHTFVELTARIPSGLKLQGLRHLKRLLKGSLVDRLPPEVLARGKQGFGVPFAAWFRGPLADFLRATLASEAVRIGGVFDPAAVTRLVAEHLAGRRNHVRLLWSVLVFELWHRRLAGVTG